MIESFPMIPATSKVLWVILPVSVLVGGVLLALMYSVYASRSVHFDVSPDGLHVVGDFWGRQLPASALNLVEARPVDLETSRDLRPKWRTWGTGLPGYQSGWFRLNDGQKALVYVTDASSVVYLPTREGYALLLSVAEPEHFLAALRQTAMAGG